MKYIIEIWGCQMNEHDSEILSDILETKGFKKAESIDKSNIVILYTCCIRKKVEDKVLGRLGVLEKLKNKKNKNLIIAIGGCMTQQENVAKMIKKRFKKVDIIFGTHNLNDFNRFLDQKLNGKDYIYDISKNNEMIIKESIIKTRISKFKAYVNIIYGCNNFCTYCVVPYVRGREKSRKIINILTEIKYLLNNGYKEITLLGQNVNSYGKDLRDNNINFKTLLNHLDNIGEYRIRFMSPHPKDFDLELINLISKSKNICNQFHLPIQSGSNKILKKMNRKYTKENYLYLINYIKKIIPEATLSTDIIVGFPGETEEDFQETLNIVNEACFDNIYMFKYSIREGTLASKMKLQVEDKVKKDRLSKLISLQRKKSLEKNKNMIGKIYEILVEEKDNNGLFIGRTDGNKIVKFSNNSNNDLIGQLVFIKITKVNSIILFGEYSE